MQLGPALFFVLGTRAAQDDRTALAYTELAALSSPTPREPVYRPA
jgi:hypothetical protein